ncbi:MAG: glycosyltransferase [Victivallaceae bacterium]|nr:glycosyltransferase [Victivallaceae bacterium]
MPLVTIVMRSKNDISYIGRTLEKILEQKFTDFEIFNFDSGSEDGTWELIRKYNPDKSRKLAPEDYVPGKILNLAVAEAEGEIIVFNNSDCVPLDENWLGCLIRPLLEPGAEKISAVFCNQLPRPDAFPLVRKDNLRAFGEGVTAAGWEHFFSLASSAALKKTLLKYPFREDLQYSEDIDWTWRLKKNGCHPVYVPEARVEHSHNYSPDELRRRFYNEGVAEAQIYGAPKPFWRGFFFPWLAETVRDICYLLKTGETRTVPCALRYRLVQRWAAWKGRRDCLKTGEAVYER